MIAVPSSQPSPPPLFSSSLSATTSATTVSSKFLIVISIIGFAVLTSVSFHLLRHLLSRRRSSAASLPPTPFRRPPSSHTEHQTSAASTPPPSGQTHVASSFPLIPISSPASVLHKSLDCAVCLSPFRPTDELRLLPSCRHAFHLQCIDMWLQSTPSCPLCRSPAAPAEEPGASSSFQVEIDLCYSMDSSVELLVSDEVDLASVDRLSRTDLPKEENGDGGEEGGFQAEIAEEGESGGRGWLRDYLDRMASSASTSFNSLTFSGRLSSHRFDSGSIESVAAGDGRGWDLDGVEWVEESGLAGIYRWFVGM